jgi:DnaJ-class molecular chaperone
MKNYYQTLGVEKTATPDEIKRAYRRLAGQHHPDRGGNTGLFQEIQAAYDVLGNPQRRAEYDNPHMGGMHFGQGFAGAQPFNFDTIFDIFGTRFQHNPFHQQRAQARMTLWVTLADVAQGGRKTISVGTQSGTHTVEIEIPEGIEDGTTVQYAGLAPGGADLIIQYRIHAHPGWQRQGLNLMTEQNITIWDCVLGVELTIRDLLGSQLTLTVPAYTQPGTILRLRGRGLRQKNGSAGDLLVRVNAVVPDQIDTDLIELIKSKQAK